MKAIPILAVAFATALLPMPALLAQRGVSEINEGTVRRTYVDRPLIGARGYVVGDWEQGQVRVEVVNFPTSETGYEAFLFEIDIPAYMSMMFVDGDPQQGIVSNPPPFDDVAGLISQWYSLGDIEVDEHGNGTLAYREGEDLAARGLNMIMVFEKVTAGRHEGPEDFARLMVECNGPLTGAPGSEGMARAIKIFP
ncbi:MAG: hypothetical protein IH965_13475 [Gemmatimonadetes bacterium]|nr:hypothetical protein [Gemmatimonadota bacterium]